MKVKNMTQTQIKIIERAIFLFAKHGFEGVRVDALAKAAGINKATLYYHYKGKQEIFEAALKYKFGKLVKTLHQTIDVKSDPTLQLKLYIVTMLQREKTLVELMSREILDGGVNIPKDVFALIIEIANVLITIINKGISLKQFREVDPFMILDVLIGAENHYIISSSLEEKFKQNRAKDHPPCPQYDIQTYAKILHQMILSILKDK